MAKKKPGRVATAVGGYGNVPGYGPVRNPPNQKPPAPAPVAYKPSIPARQDLPVDAAYDDQIGGLQRRRDDDLAALGNAQTRTLSDYGYSATFDEKGGLTGLAVDPNNPFSRASLLRKSYQQSKARTQNSMAARGQLYAGALNRMQSSNDLGYARDDNQLQGGLRDVLLGLADRRRQVNSDYELGAGQAMGDRVSRAVQSPLYQPAPSASGSATPTGSAAPAFTAKPGTDSKGNPGTWHYYTDGRKPVFIAAKR